MQVRKSGYCKPTNVTIKVNEIYDQQYFVNRTLKWLVVIVNGKRAQTSCTCTRKFFVNVRDVHCLVVMFSKTFKCNVCQK